MSEFHEVELDIDDGESLVKTLEDMGYHPQVHETAQPLEGYRGDQRSQKAHIIIPKQQVGSSSNDLGFEKVNGKYVMRISAFDIGARRFNQEEFNKHYKKNSVLKTLNKSRKFKKKSITTREDGKIVIRLKGR